MLLTRMPKYSHCKWDMKNEHSEHRLQMQNVNVQFKSQVAAKFKSQVAKISKSRQANHSHLNNHFTLLKRVND